MDDTDLAAIRAELQQLNETVGLLTRTIRRAVLLWTIPKWPDWAADVDPEQLERVFDKLLKDVPFVLPTDDAAA